MTIAKQLNIKVFPFIIKDDAGNQIYYEERDGKWRKYEYDNNRNIIYYEDSSGYWIKKEWGDFGKEIYFENSDGIIRDNRPNVVPEYTMEELENQLGFNFKIKK